MTTLLWGGPYAVACAALLGDRVAAARVVAGVTDMGWEPAWDGLDPAKGDLMRVGDGIVPVAHARHTAELIPTASLRIWPEHGHLTIPSEIPSLAATLVGGLRPPG